MPPSVAEFYEGKSILVTGATGFLGKVLIEKLLRACTGIKTIYLLMRQKKGVSAEERLKELCNNKLFEALREKQPEVFQKLKLVAGDILEEELGLSNDDRQELQRNCQIVFHSAACVREMQPKVFQKLKLVAGDILEEKLGLSNADRQELQRNCQIVFHSAACVRFDQKLKDAVHLNTTGTWRVLKLAETMEKIEAFVHLSTAYCRCELDVLEEKLYPAVHKPQKIMDIVDWMDDDMLRYLEPKIIVSEPNTYSYTKAITEDLVADFSNRLPIAIGRPSIVTSAWKEPMPGWVDNMNGPTGLLIGSGKGVIRTMHCEPSYVADAIPVDVTANGCILIAYVTAIDKPKEMRIFNITLSGVQKITWKEVIETGRKLVNTYPFTIALWYPGGTIKSYWLSHQLCLLFTHILPAYLVDMLLFLLGKKTFMVNAQKRISHGLGVIQFYTTKEWHFKNTNFLSLQKRVSPEENEIFYTDVSTLDKDEYLRDYVLGARHYVCKEDPASLPRARRLHKIRYAADIILKMVLYSLFAWFLYTYLGVFTSTISSVDSSLRSWLHLDSGRVEEIQ